MRHINFAMSISEVRLRQYQYEKDTNDWRKITRLFRDIRERSGMIQVEAHQDIRRDILISLGQAAY